MKPEETQQTDNETAPVLLEPSEHDETVRAFAAGAEAPGGNSGPDNDQNQP